MIYCYPLLIAGAASTRGASHILLQLSELTLIDCVSSPTAIAEAERNITAKLPAASSAFRKILAATVDVVPEATLSLKESLAEEAHPKDLAILAAAVAGAADFFATFNVRHYQKRTEAPIGATTSEGCPPPTSSPKPARTFWKTADCPASSRARRSGWLSISERLSRR